MTNSSAFELLFRQDSPEILSMLLIDRTKSTPKKTKNIIWANDHYIDYGEWHYHPQAEIKPELICGNLMTLIQPRAFKTLELQKERTRNQAEVFTPTWIVKKQNDAVDQNFQQDSLETYVNRTWLEITCGEAPYIVSRYEMETGESIDIEERVGFLDRKLQRINHQVDDYDTWQSLTIQAYKATYGFEWNGDSLLLARENLLYTYIDFYKNKWHRQPTTDQLLKIAEIISYNLFQMDGLKYIIPLSETTERVEQTQLSLFDDEPQEVTYQTLPGTRVKIMNWKTNQMEYFDEGVK